MVKYWSSKSTSGVRFPPTSMIYRILLLKSKSITTILSLIFITLVILMNDFFTGNSFAQKAILGFGFGFAVYWVVSIFVFLFKRSLYTSYTVVIQRYWKRSLYLFWVLELFLFSIYVYLILVTPTEVEWLLDQPQLFHSNWWNGSLFFMKLIIVLAIILIAILLSYVLLNQNSLLMYTLILLNTILLSVILFSDSAQTFMYSIFYSGISWEYDLDKGAWLINSEVDKLRTVTHYMFLITVLKYWHTVFIVAVWLVTTMFVLQSPYVGQGAFAANKQNFYFLYGFAFIWTLFLYKVYANHLYEYVYQWFFVNPWGISLVGITTFIEPILCLF